MPKRLESQFVTSDNSEIFFQQWETRSPRGQILITHGLGEHSDCYNQLADSLNADKWNLFAWDLRGHGKSSGKRGYVAHFDNFISDLKTFHKFLTDHRFLHKDKPTVFLGHSMGGLIILKTLITVPLKASAICLSAPTLGLNQPPSDLKVWTTRTAAKLFPQLTISTQIKLEELTRDPQRIDSYKRDILRHFRISFDLYMGMLESFDYVEKNLSQLQIPMLFQIPGKDTIVNNAKTLEICQSLDSKLCQIRHYPESFHEVLQDLDHQKAFKDIKDFINKL